MILFDRDRQLNFPGLKRLEAEMQSLQASNEELQWRQTQLDVQAQQDAMDANKTYSIDQMQRLSVERAKMKAEVESLDTQLAFNNRRFEEARSEHDQLRTLFDSLCSSRERLFRELGQARTDEDLSQTRSELVPVLKILARASGDRKAVQECEKIEAEHLASLPYVILKHGYAWTSRQADRRLVVDDDPAARITAYGPGVQVDRQEAEQVGLLALEAS